MTKEMWLYAIFIIWLSCSLGYTIWVYDIYKKYKQDITLKHLFIILFAPLITMCELTDTILFKLSSYAIIKYINRKER